MLPNLREAFALGLGLLFVGSNWYSYHTGGVNMHNAIDAGAAREEKIGKTAYENSQKATAEEIANIHVLNTTVKQTLEKEVQHEISYTDCRNSDDAMRLLNQSLTGSITFGQPVGDRQLPEAHALGR